ncbi:hypothetical protein C7399_14028 [Paraburkholderia tropica]|uniref:Uncharacterized protein n=2 Tax=Paraburkholderia tropica TaxID=92647 RepID=A0ABX5MC86_9BURK|nr:hypothetical protein C7400_14028 [Paraburkholderia tropica]PZW70777.1 hypothetical protein C7399_14028 [Paraburkholderia tropica]
MKGRRMEDLAWLVRDSASAWLRGYGDGRFAGYESFYREARNVAPESFDLERLNEDYSAWVRERPSRFVSALNRPIVARALIAFLTVWIGAQTVPHAAGYAPKTTAGLLVAVFVGLRIFHRQRRKGQI